MSTETSREIHDPYQKDLLRSVEKLSCLEDQKVLLRRIIRSDRSCRVIRSDGRQERGKIIGIDPEGRIGVAVKDTDENHTTTKWPRLETFMSWQEPSENL